MISMQVQKLYIKLFTKIILWSNTPDDYIFLY